MAARTPARRAGMTISSADGPTEIPELFPADAGPVPGAGRGVVAELFARALDDDEDAFQTLRHLELFDDTAAEAVMALIWMWGHRLERAGLLPEPDIARRDQHRAALRDAAAAYTATRDQEQAQGPGGRG